MADADDYDELPDAEPADEDVDREWEFFAQLLGETYLTPEEIAILQATEAGFDDDLE